jgi:hypothetical protein
VDRGLLWRAGCPRARYQRYEDLLKQASGDPDRANHDLVAERLGQNVVDFEGLTKGFGDRF